MPHQLAACPARAAAFQNIDWLFFDGGEVLLDESAAWEAADGEMIAHARSLGMSVTYDQWRSALLETAPQVANPIRATQERLGLDRPPGQIWPHHLVRPYPDATTVLEMLAASYHLGPTNQWKPRRSFGSGACSTTSKCAFFPMKSGWPSRTRESSSSPCMRPLAGPNTLR